MVYSRFLPLQINVTSPVGFSQIVTFFILFIGDNMLRVIRYFTVLFLLSSTSVIFACQFDLDCGIGSQCVKTGANLYGYCVGGMNPGNSNDKNPAQKVEPNQAGCQFDNQCQIGSKCVKEQGNSYGYCVTENLPPNQNHLQNTDANHNKGDTCQFDIDCGIGRKCIKGSADIYGTCL